MQCNFISEKDSWIDECKRCSQLSLQTCHHGVLISPLFTLVLCKVTWRHLPSECFLSMGLHPLCICTKRNNRMSAHFLMSFLASSSSSFPCSGTQRLVLLYKAAAHQQRGWGPEGRPSECAVVVRCTRCEKAICGRWYVGSVRGRSVRTRSRDDTKL